MHLACLLLGSNIEPEHNIPRAVKLLQEQLTILKASSVWETASVDCCYPDFLNLALLVSISLSATDLKEQVLRPMEAKMGRVRTEDKNASRTIDCDIIIFDGELVDPQLWQHVHQAVPIAEIMPDFLSDTGETITQAARRLAESTPIRLRQDVAITLSHSPSRR